MAPVDARGRPGDRGAYRWLAQQPQGGAIELPILEWAIAPTLTYQYATLVARSSDRQRLQRLRIAAAGISRRRRVAAERSRSDGRRAGPVARASACATCSCTRATTPIRTWAPRRSRPSARSRAWRRRPSARTRSSPFGGRCGSRGGCDPPAMPVGTRLRASDFHADASDAADRLPLAFDGDGDTRWLTGRPQNGDEWIRIAFDRTRDVSAIELQTAARSFGDYPRELLSKARPKTERGRCCIGARCWCRTAARSPRAGRSRRSSSALPANHTRTLTIRQTGHAPPLVLVDSRAGDLRAIERFGFGVCQCG